MIDPSPCSSSISKSSSSLNAAAAATNRNNDVSSDALRNAVAGAMSGAFSRTVTAPIERVKLMLQLQGSSSSLSPSTTSSAWEVCRQIYNVEGGLIAFWRGNTPNVLRQAGVASLNFMFLDWYKSAIVSPIMSTATQYVPSNRPREEREKMRKIISAFLAGGLAGGTTTTFLYPTEFMRTRLALDAGSSSSRMYPRGMRDVFSAIWNTDGIRGIYQGYGIALFGVILYRALHLGGYDAFKTELTYRRRSNIGQGSSLASDNNALKITMSERFAIAQIVSLIAGTICYPVDSVRRRLMMQAGRSVDGRPYKNSKDAFKKIFMQEGLRGFYLGLGPNIVRSIAGALLLVSYDVFRGETSA